MGRNQHDAFYSVLMYYSQHLVNKTILKICTYVCECMCVVYTTTLWWTFSMCRLNIEPTMSPISITSIVRLHFIREFHDKLALQCIPDINFKIIQYENIKETTATLPVAFIGFIECAQNGDREIARVKSSPHHSFCLQQYVM